MILARMAAGRITISRPRPHRWPALLLPSFWLMLNLMFASVYYHGTSFAIGLLCDTAIIGIYFWGFRVSSQVLNFLSTNLKDVLFPTLLRLNWDSRRQYRGYCKASRALLFVVAPVCLLQALLAGPLVAMVFPTCWLPAVGVVKWLSLGMISQPLSVLLPLAYVAYVVFRRGLSELMSLGCLGVLFMWGGYQFSPWLCYCSGEWTSSILVEAFIDAGLIFSTLCILTFVAGHEYSMKKHRGGRFADAEMEHLLPPVRIKWLLGLMLLTSVMFVVRVEGFAEAWHPVSSTPAPWNSGDWSSTRPWPRVCPCWFPTVADARSTWSKTAATVLASTPMTPVNWPAI